MNPKVKFVSISKEKGVSKTNVDEIHLVENHGVKNDAHAGDAIRQVSLLSFESIKNFPGDFKPGEFAENITTQNINLLDYAVGTKLQIGESLIEITQIGKNCHSGCHISKKTGQCIMPKQGVFAKVLKNGKVKPGDDIVALS